MKSVIFMIFLMVCLVYFMQNYPSNSHRLVSSEEYYLKDINVQTVSFGLILSNV